MNLRELLTVDRAGVRGVAHIDWEQFNANIPDLLIFSTHRIISVSSALSLAEFMFGN